MPGWGPSIHPSIHPSSIRFLPILSYQLFCSILVFVPFLARRKLSRGPESMEAAGASSLVHITHRVDLVFPSPLPTSPVLNCQLLRGWASARGCDAMRCDAMRCDAFNVTFKSWAEFRDDAVCVQVRVQAWCLPAVTDSSDLPTYLGTFLSVYLTYRGHVKGANPPEPSSRSNGRNWCSDGPRLGREFHASRSM